MALGKQLPIRLDEDVEKRLESVASTNGTTKSALVRLLAKTFVDQVVRPDGGISMPPNWAALLPVADGRARALKSRVDHSVVKLNCETDEGQPPKKRAKKKP